jgi:geranyl-CoA carboxylase alpha subunit
VGGHGKVANKRRSMATARAAFVLSIGVMSVSKILVANRGEIALRVMRSAKQLGYPCVAVYSDADVAAPHVAAADEAVHLGPAPARDSYLVIDKLIQAAKQTACDAVHPGYGFLSENAEFARACVAHGLTFIGPSPEAIELMGNKRAAKEAMQAAGVPCIAGYNKANASDDELVAAATQIGFPLMVKATAGGGGRGMRLVREQGELKDALVSARTEAGNAFGNDELMLEQAVLEPRHIEVQIFGDQRGQVVHLGERDCSVQRRHQKVIEEAPSPAVDVALRQKLGAAAVQAARACAYVGAGTVEMLLNSKGEFFFLEMNTRLQVEHCVTEMVTGVDLVEWQLRVASGEALPLSQDAISIQGHAIEARLYAEDPDNNYLPQTGEVRRWQLPAGLRVDHAVSPGMQVSAHYDPMLAKVIAYGKTRNEALRKLEQGLGETRLFGVVSNKNFLRDICQLETFASGQATTALLADGGPQRRPTDTHYALAALVVAYRNACRLGYGADMMSWASASSIWSALAFVCGEDERKLRFSRSEDGFLVQDEAGENEQAMTLIAADEEHLVVVSGGVRRRLSYWSDGDELWLDDGYCYRFYDYSQRPAQRSGTAGTGRLVAPLDGAVVELRAVEGATVAPGDVVLVIEAMKMQHRVVADIHGRLEMLCVSPSQQVKKRQLLAQIAPGEE